MINSSSFNNAHGSSLVETLIALLVTAIGLLGVLAMQTKAIQLNKNAYHYSQAAILANDMMETLRLYSTLNAGAVQTDFDDEAQPQSNDSCVLSANSPCDNQAAVFTWSRDVWKQNLESLLPVGQGRIHVSADGTYHVQVRFQIGLDESGQPLFNDPPVSLAARL